MIHLSNSSSSSMKLDESPKEKDENYSINVYDDPVMNPKLKLIKETILNIKKEIDKLDLINVENDNEDNSNMWTDDIEDQVELFASICEEEANEYKNKSRKQFYIGRTMQISLIIFGSLSVYSSASNIDITIKDSINIIAGFSTTVISSIYTMFGFTKNSTLTFETSLGLDGISRMIRCELLKPKKLI